jgi:hypothetical protein
MMIGNMFTFNNTPTLHNTQGYFSPPGTSSYYGIAQPFQEIGGID